MTETLYYPERDEISLLSLQQIIVDNLRLLVIGAIVAGLLALAFASLWPQAYESTAMLKAQPSVTSSLGHTPKMPSGDVHKKIKEQIKGGINNKDKRLNLTTQANTPQAAQVRTKEATQAKQLLARNLDSAGSTSVSEMAHGYAQMIDVTKNGYGQYLIFVPKNIALL